MVSIKDIARRAGVSISTVSYALNGNPKVTEETSKRILAVAKELNYVPNAAARTLKKRETRIIGAFLTTFEGAFYGKLLQGMKEEMNKRGYDLVICSGTQSHRMLPEGILDGAIILDRLFSDEELLLHANRGHKLVVLDRELKHDNIVQVLLDNKAGATFAMEYLIRNGHQKLYAVTGPEGSFDSEQRLGAARQTVERGGPLITYKEIPGNFDKASGEAAALRIISEYDGPVGVFCLNDEMAIGMYQALRGTPYRVGEHIHVVGFDHIDITDYVQPRMATIDYSERRWGAVAAEQLIKLVEGDSSAQHERIYVGLVEGESVGPASAGM
ncbi:LacI family DNA-binding transcriptional regulator [Paenibacillus sp. F411]|uniref:Transcriptional regulator, LacI family n=1 Tax=Paenibacillus algicola TaxID=2565926 RepID=A0A4P8XNC0_9BACL|nr:MULTISPECIES: LacI family DNA-binding transcriptional regulator [Paenibacillus]MBO2944085.1 LacI family DNA-binding transcriptional regulator [Paenibacillus sp. F411]QCT01809.1 transcriptional regulator, LacI family [Paenibacillus algicola]